MSKVASDGAKLLCPNGNYAFATETLGPFAPSIVCSASIPWDWPEHFNEADMDYLDKVLYQDPFDDLRIGEIEKHYHMRGVIGDFRMKKVLVALGPPNSGKGVKVALMQAALGRGLVGSFNGNDLLLRQNVDSDLELSFVGRVANGRMAVSSEIKFDKNAAIDGNKLKSISGGGGVLECRGKFERSSFVIPKRLFVIVANDLPTIAPADEAVLSRLVVVQPSLCYIGVQKRL